VVTVAFGSTNVKSSASFELFSRLAYGIDKFESTDKSCAFGQDWKDNKLSYLKVIQEDPASNFDLDGAILFHLKICFD
jgi:hypothetical protein